MDEEKIETPKSGWEYFSGSNNKNIYFLCVFPDSWLISLYLYFSSSEIVKTFRKYKLLRTLTHIQFLDINIDYIFYILYLCMILQEDNGLNHQTQLMKMSISDKFPLQLQGVNYYCLRKKSINQSINCWLIVDVLLVVLLIYLRISRLTFTN